MVFAIRIERSKKYFLYLIPACCNEGRLSPNQSSSSIPVLTSLVIPDSCHRKDAFQVSPHNEQQLKYLSSWKDFCLSVRNPKHAAECSQKQQLCPCRLCAWDGDGGEEPWRTEPIPGGWIRVYSLLLLLEMVCFPCLNFMRSWAQAGCWSGTMHEWLFVILIKIYEIWIWSPVEPARSCDKHSWWGGENSPGWYRSLKLHKVVSWDV